MIEIHIQAFRVLGGLIVYRISFEYIFFNNLWLRSTLLFNQFNYYLYHLVYRLLIYESNLFDQITTIYWTLPTCYTII